MKSRLSPQFGRWSWFNGLVLFGVLMARLQRGRLSNGASMLDFGSLPSGASGSVVLRPISSPGRHRVPGLAAE